MIVEADELLDRLPASERGIILALGSGLFVPIGGLMAIAWRPRRVDRQLSRMVAFSAGALITATMLEIFPTALSATVDEGHGEQWSYAFCTSVMFVSVVAIVVGRRLSDQPAHIIDRAKDLVTRRKEAEILGSESRGAQLANKFIHDWKGFDGGRYLIDHASMVRPSFNRQNSRDSAVGSASDLPGDDDRLSYSSVASTAGGRVGRLPRRTSIDSVASTAGGSLGRQPRRNSNGLLAAQMIAHGLLGVARGDGDLRGTLDVRMGYAVAERGSVTREEFFSLVLDATKADDLAFAEQLWSELDEAGPSLELLAEMLEPFWSPEHDHDLVDRMISVASSLRTYKLGGSTKTFNQIASSRRVVASNAGGIRRTGHLAMEKLEEWIEETLVPIIRTFSDHVASFVSHIISGIVIYYISQVDERTATILVVMNVLHNVPEGILLTGEAITSGTLWLKRFCRAFTGSLLIGLSECLGAALAYFLTREGVKWPRKVYIGLYLFAGGLYIYYGVVCYLNKAKDLNPDNEFPSWAFMFGTTVMGFAMVPLEAGPLRTSSFLGS